MVLLSDGTLPKKTDREERIISTPSPTPFIPQPPDRGWADWGLALGVAAWAGSKLWGLFSSQQSADTQLLHTLIQATLEENKELRRYMLDRKS
jgi:hypothetical protein